MVKGMAKLMERHSVTGKPTVKRLLTHLAMHLAKDWLKERLMVMRLAMVRPKDSPMDLHSAKLTATDWQKVSGKYLHLDLNSRKQWSMEMRLVMRTDWVRPMARRMVRLKARLKGLPKG